MLTLYYFSRSLWVRIVITNNTLKRKFLNTLLFFGVLSGCVMLYQHYFVVNFTKSMPLGVYFKSYPASYTKNDTVLVCLDDEIARWSVDHHIIAGGLGCRQSAPLLKKIVATEGDRVTVTHKGIVVNDVLVPNTAPIARKIKQWNIIDREILLKPTEYIVVANQNNLSFDSRYFGVVTDRNITAKIRLFYLFD